MKIPSLEVVFLSGFMGAIAVTLCLAWAAAFVSQEPRPLAETYACFDGMNQVCDKLGCSVEESQKFARACKVRFKTNDPKLWACNCV